MCSLYLLYVCVVRTFRLWQSFNRSYVALVQISSQLDTRAILNPSATVTRGPSTKDIWTLLTFFSSLLSVLFSNKSFLCKVKTTSLRNTTFGGKLHDAPYYTHTRRGPHRPYGGAIVQGFMLCYTLLLIPCVIPGKELNKAYLFSQ